MSPLTLDRLDLRDLLFFETIAEFNHLGRAAKKLCRTQPALTRCVHRLEEALGVRLFERVGRGINITPIGLLLLKRVRVLRRVAEDTLLEIKDFEHGSSGHVVLGSGPITSERLLPAVCQVLRSQGESVTIEVVIRWNFELLSMLRAGNLDLVFGPIPESQDDLLSRPLIEDVFAIVARTGHEIFRKRRIKLQDLLAHGWVLPTQQSASRQWIDRTFELNGLAKPIVKIECNVISLLSSVVARSELISFMSRHHPRPPHLREIPIKEAVMHRRLGVTWRKDSYLSPAAHRFVEAVNANALDLLHMDKEVK
jgi:DNA-binding transcriptional LysR family regulator